MKEIKWPRNGTVTSELLFEPTVNQTYWVTYDLKYLNGVGVSTSTADQDPDNDKADLSHLTGKLEKLKPSSRILIVLITSKPGSVKAGLSFTFTDSEYDQMFEIDANSYQTRHDFKVVLT